MRKAETGKGAKVTEWKQQAKTNTTLLKGNQPQQSSVPEKKMGTGTTYGGSDAPMDIDRARSKTKCFQCGKIRHFKRDCPKAPKMKEEALRHLNYYWNHVAMNEKTDLKVEEVKDRAEQ